jgi:hypothetical protein
MRPFMTMLFVLGLVVPTFATDYTITSGYYYGTKTYQNWDTLLMTGGGVESITADDHSFLDIRNTSPYSPLSGGIGTLDLGASSQLDFSGGQMRNFTISGNATAVFSGGRIDKIYGYQTTTYLNYFLGTHIEMIVKDYSVTNNILTGHWEDNSAFSVQLMNQTGYIPVISLIEFTIIPEPATLLLLGFGGLLIRRKK